MVTEQCFSRQQVRQTSTKHNPNLNNIIYNWLFRLTNLKLSAQKSGNISTALLIDKMNFSNQLPYAI